MQLYDYSIQERNADYLLLNLSFDGLGSPVLKKIYEDAKMDDVGLDTPGTTVNISMIGQDPRAFTFNTCLYRYGRRDHDTALSVPCDEIAGVQYAQTIYDGHVLAHHLLGRRPAWQDGQTLQKMQRQNAVHKQQGFLPRILCTDRAVLPASLRLQPDDHAMAAYLEDFERDYSAMTAVWGKETDLKLQKYARQLQHPVQFLAFKELNDDFDYELYALETSGRMVKLGVIEDYDSLCTDLSAWQDGYVEAMPGQPQNIRQQWAQNVVDWSDQAEGKPLFHPSFIRNLADRTKTSSTWHDAVRDDTDVPYDARWQVTQRDERYLYTLGDRFLSPN